MAASTMDLVPPAANTSAVSEPSKASRPAPVGCVTKLNRLLVEHIENLPASFSTSDPMLKSIKKPFESDQQTMLRMLEHRPATACAALLRILGKTKADFLQPVRSLIEYTSFNVVGCPLSTDIDVICVVPLDTKVTEPLSNKDKLLRELYTLGYDTTRSLDINLVHVSEDGNIIHSTRGLAAETQNIVFHTYRHHKQAYALIATSEGTVSPEDKYRALSKCVFDTMKILLAPEVYTSLRSRKTMLYSKPINDPDRVKFVDEILSMIRPKDHIPNGKPDAQSAIKSLTMKMIQLQILPQRVYEKIAMAETRFQDNQEHAAGAIWLLTRGKIGRACKFVWSILCSHSSRGF